MLQEQFQFDYYFFFFFLGESIWLYFHMNELTKMVVNVYYYLYLGKINPRYSLDMHLVLEARDKSDNFETLLTQSLDIWIY